MLTAEMLLLRLRRGFFGSGDGDDMAGYVRQHDSEFYVTDPTYGAVGNGVADDTAAIQACIDAAEAYAIANETGAVVHFPSGTYLVSSTLTVTEHCVHLIGAGGGTALFTHKGTTIVPTENFANDTYVVKFDWAGKSFSLYGNRMKDITIAPPDGDWEFDNTVHGVYWGVAKGFMQDVQMNSLTGTGLRLQGHSASFKLIESRFTGIETKLCGHGLEYLGSCSDNWFMDCQFQGSTTGAGINGLSANDYYIACHFTGNLNNIRSDGGGTEALFVGCNFETPREHNVLLDSTNGGASRMRFIGCQFNSNALTANNTYDTIFVTGSGGSFSGVIDGCTFAGDGANQPRYHINFSNASASSFHAANNSLSGAATANTNLGANSVRCTINGMGRNVGNPASTGAWNGNGRHGVLVRDTGGTTIYTCYDGTNWVALN